MIFVEYYFGKYFSLSVLPGIFPEIFLNIIIYLIFPLQQQINLMKTRRLYRGDIVN
jgi:hypothetical protein